MEGSRRSSGGSGSRLGMSSGAGFNKRDGWGLPPTAPRPNRRSARRGNFNNGNSEMIVDVQMEQSADERAREANRKNAEAIRHRRQNLMQQLEYEVKNKEKYTEHRLITTERKENRAEFEALKNKCLTAKADLVENEVETKMLNEEIEKLKRMMEAEDEEIKNLMKNNPIYRFWDDTFNPAIDALTTPPPNADPSGGDEA